MEQLIQELQCALGFAIILVASCGLLGLVFFMCKVLAEFIIWLEKPWGKQ